MDSPDAGAPPLNRVQRCYFRWAAPWYARMEPGLREEARRIDTFLYSARGLWVWAGVVCAIVGSTFGLAAAGLPPALALLCSSAVWVALLGAGLSAWLMPERHTARRLGRTAVVVTGMAFAGALTGFLVARAAVHGARTPGEFIAPLGDAFLRAAPVLLLGGVALVVVMAIMARLRRWQMARELAHLRLEQALEVARRQAAEARLAALQAQVQPHFIFNTLAALQHWVDEGDPRAAPLLRALTGFLRGSTELLARDSATLGDELPLVEHYLAVMQARWGERLRSRVDADAASRAVQLPPGLLLTLVENAVEHGAGARLEGGEVRVRVQVDGARCQVEVSDNGPGLAPGWQEGVGLGNVRQRLAHRFGDRARLVLEDAAPGVRARIELDLREEAPHGH